MTVFTDTKLCMHRRKVTVRGKCAARVCDISIVEKPIIVRIFPHKNITAESVCTRAKLSVPMNIIGGSSTLTQQHSITPSLVEKHRKAEHICIST